MFSSEVPVEVHGGGRFIIRNSTPAYLRTYEERCLKEKVEEALESLHMCTLCPRNCRINRLEGRFAVCKVGRLARVSAFFPHLGEEDVLRGWRGSGTVFSSWCNLRCVFCQNFETSQMGAGVEVTPQELAEMMLRLQEMGCHNINFVTPEHVVPQILEALPYAIERGLLVPLVYNTGAYDSLHSVELMNGVVDIYMPDFKLWDQERSRRFLLAPNYPEAARQTIAAMHRQVGELKVDQEGVAQRGVLVRHLVMPGMLEDTENIMNFLGQLSQDTYVKIMGQYHPAWKAQREAKYAGINRRISTDELSAAVDYARKAGLWRFDSHWRVVRQPHLVCFAEGSNGREQG